MRHLIKPAALKAAALLTLFAGPLAGQLYAAPWTSFAGPASAGQVNYANGAFNTGLFGSPSAAPVNNTFTWNPLIGTTGFEANSENLQTTIKNDFVSFDVTETGALDVTTVTATLTGRYSYFGTPGGSLKVDGVLEVTYISGGIGMQSATTSFVDIVTLTPIPLVSVTGFEEAQYTGTATLAIPSGVTSFTVKYFSEITASSLVGGTTTVGNQTLTISVPEPTSLALVGAAGVMLLKRRRNA